MNDCHKSSSWKIPAKIIKIETGNPYPFAYIIVLQKILFHLNLK